jgi:LAO/AO transport system kinase
LDEIFAGAHSGDIRALARAISLVEERVPGVETALDGLSIRRRVGPGAPRVLGITGPPGAGKSTLVDRLIARARAGGRTVAVLAVDPSSPFSGGAILGDRLRMQSHALDTGVFIRSVSARGHLGGLSRATGQVVDLFDAAGWDEIIVETVGVGQSELAVCEVADTAVVVLTPECGDTVQAMKAGLLEIADVFLVNKADRPGAEALARELEQAVHLNEGGGWQAPVLTTSALEDQGIEAALDAIGQHAQWLCGEGRSEWEARRGRGRLRTLLDLAAEAAREEAAAFLQRDSALAAALEGGDMTPAAAWAKMKEDG